jgi:RimJ/RimL family protein N-acetyltransferase
MNADPVVMEYFPSTQTVEESDATIARGEVNFEQHGYGFWALEVPGEEPFAGFVGLQPVPADMPCAPAVEIGWRLTPRLWGRGLVTEAGRAALAYGFGHLELSEIVAFTAAGNARSRAVMERLGMTREPADDFLHPALPVGHPLQSHVLYRIAAPT